MESAILFRVEHLKQRSRRIALEVAAYLVDFVEQQYGIGSTGTLYGIDYTTRHRSYISATVSAYFSFVMKAAQRYTLIFASERARHRLAQRGLSHSGRSYKAENRSLALRVVKQHGYLLKDTLLDLGKSIMVGIKDILCQIEIGIQVRILVPRQFKQGFYIGILNRIVGALRIQSSQFVKLLVKHGSYIGRKINLISLTTESSQIVIVITV